MTTDGSTPRAPLAVGRTAEVFAWGDGRVLKLLRPGFADSLGEEEAIAAGRAAGAGLAAPRLLGTVRVDGRFGLVYERLHGPSMVQLVLEQSALADPMAARLAELHAAMHAHDAAGLPDAHDRLRHAIDDAGRILGSATRDAALRRLASLGRGHSILHGDLHPGNVVMSDRGPIVIDWLTATAGPPAADVARTIMLLTDTVLGDDIGPQERPLVERLRHRFADAYLRRYRELRPLDPGELAAWRLPTLVARAAERVAGEEGTLPALIERER